MAFILSSSAFLGSRTTTKTRKCSANPARLSANRRVWHMTTTLSVPRTSTQGDSDEDLTPVPVVPPYERVPLTKGSTFNAVRFAKDDFETTPYFQGLTGKGVKVAVLDTGCDKKHPALKNRIDYDLSRNYTTGTASGWEDLNGHGTHCAGIIAAEANEAPMYGVAPEATIVVKKVLGPGGSGPRLSAHPIADAIRDAVDEGCHVLSLSLGHDHIVRRTTGGTVRVPWRLGRGSRFDEYMNTLYESIMYALSKKAIVVVAAGNAGAGKVCGSIHSLLMKVNTTQSRHLGGVITVASHDDTGKRSRFSSRGGELDFMAPGEVISTWPLSVPKTAADGSLTRDMVGYSALSGTSMATPLVAGLAVLLVEAGERAKIGNLVGLSASLIKDIEDTGFQARNLFEVREMLRVLSDHPNEHDRETGYGKLSRAYEYVKETVNADI